MGAMDMYIDCVYRCYIHVYWLCIWVLYACILVVRKGAIYMYIDCVYGCYACVLIVLYACMLIVYMDAIYMYIVHNSGIYI